MTDRAFGRPSGGRRVEQALAAFTLFLGMSAAFPVFDGSGNNLDPASRDPLTEHLWWFVYLAYACAVLATRSQGIIALRLSRMPLLIALIGWAAASVVWSDASSVTERRLVALSLTTVVAVHLASRMTREEFVQILALTLAAVSIGSAIVASMLPRYGLDHLRGDAWRGLLSTKNGLGRIACLTVLVWLYRLRARETRVWLAGPVAFIALVDILQSHSRTSLAISLLMILVVLASGPLQADYRAATAASMLLLAVAGVTVFWLLTHTEAVLSSVGSSDSLTGRTSIWSAAWYMAKRHFWFGYGYNGFWTGINGPSGALWGIVGSTPPHAHNGFLDTWLDLGAIGVALLVAFLLWALYRAWLQMRGGGAEGMWPLLFLFFLLAFNLSESSFLVRNSVFWMMFVVASVWVSSPVDERRAYPARVLKVRPGLTRVMGEHPQ